ncbi:hypothetical protein BH10ACT2_BH10ACT2_24140 [soil metagenome]
MSTGGLGRGCHLTIRALKHDDLQAARTINESNLSDVDSISIDELGRVLADGRIALAAVEPGGSVVGFCLIIDEACGYLSERAAWSFRTSQSLRNSQPSEFGGSGLHIDRVVFDMNFSGFGLGLALYNELDAAIAELGPTTLTSLVRTDPPNKHSVGFHERRGFVTIAQSTFGGQQFALTRRVY